jgi:hypothetical protein
MPVAELLNSQEKLLNAQLSFFLTLQFLQEQKMKFV